jgi:hypothetical protein
MTIIYIADKLKVLVNITLNDMIAIYILYYSLILCH